MKNSLQCGERVYIRRLRAADEEDFLRLSRRDRRYHRPWVYPPLNSGDFRSLLQRARRPAQVCCVVCRIDNAALVGVINISEIVRGKLQSAYLGYYGFSDSAGEGLMTEALQLVCRHAFNDLLLHRLEANIQPLNTRSYALARRCGFKKEGFSPRYLKVGGRWRDHYRLALLKEGFRCQRG